MAIRAVAQDKEAAALQGVSVDRISALTFGIGCGLAATAGALVAPIFGVNPSMGNEVILKAFLVVILGGMGSVPGAMLGGLVLGFVESFGCLFFTVPTVMVLTFIIIIIILIVRPQGLLGHDAEFATIFARLFLLLGLPIPLFTSEPYVLPHSLPYRYKRHFACSLNAILKIGELNLAQAAFMGIGAYASTLLVMRLGVLLGCLPLHRLITAVVSLPIGF